jgi:hypothetical protein
MEHVGAAGTGAREQIDPGRDEPLITRIVDGGKDAIGGTRAILVGRREGNRRNQRLRARKRRRVVERVDVEPGEEARRVRRLAPPSQRARGQRQPPAGGRQCASERAHDLRRAAAGEKEERRDDQSACHRRAAATRTTLPPRQVARCPHGAILVLRPSGGSRFRLGRSHGRAGANRAGYASPVEGDAAAARSRIVRASAVGATPHDRVTAGAGYAAGATIGCSRRVRNTGRDERR